MRATGRQAILILLLLAGCASGAPDDPNAPQITLHLEQYESPNTYTFSGPVNVGFALSVANTTNQPVKLNRIEIRIADTGPGLAPEVAANLFQPFVTTKRNGMGVGLSICRTIVEAHDGTIRAGASPGGGAAFHLTLPLSPEDDAP